MLRKVTLKPFTSAPNVSPTSRMMDAMKYESSKRIRSEQIWPAKRIQRNSCCQCLNNLLPVETAVFDENLAGVPASDNHARKVDSRHVALQRIRIQRRPTAFRIELHAQALDK